jgi:hypothetical protein
MKNLYLLVEKNSDKSMSHRDVRKCVLKLRLSKDLSEIERQKTILELYILCAPIILKAINNFFYLTRNFSKERVLHTREDIAIECFISLNTHVKNMKIKEYKKFHFFLNSGLNRVTYRIYERQYLKHSQVIDNSEDNEFVVGNSAKYNQSFDLTELDLEKLDLTDMERKILVMKVEGVKFQEFLKENKIQHFVYKESLETLQNKLLKIYRNGKR